MKEQNIIHNEDSFISLIPEKMTKFPRGPFDPLPKFTISEGVIDKGYLELTARIKNKISGGLRVLVIDGYQGVNWKDFIGFLFAALSPYELSVEYIDIADAYASQEEIQSRIEPFLGGGDPLFGMHYPFGIEFLFDAKKLSDARIKASVARGYKPGNLTIVYGSGASLIELQDELWYIDVPKDYIQESARNGDIYNLGINEKVSMGVYYKRSYFIEWPALNRLKRKLLPLVDIFIDLQAADEPAFINGDDLRKALKEIAHSPFRLRPWFYPGPWGGKFMQGHMGLDPEAPNFAWSFEMIVPENGIVIEKNNVSLEFSFDCLMYMHNKKVLGVNAAKQFKYEWPIRFDYLDTIEGGNLSVQVHPRPNYIKNNFGETFTQDETYYICASKPGAEVYLGLTEDCNKDEFKKNLEDSIIEGKEVEIEKYVNHEPSKPHDLFLIPNGTVHCSGSGNLVLEISATPYIFTFKIYDYLRRDLEGNLRPINIDRAFENIRFERRKKWVRENLIAKPRVLRKGEDWKEVVLYDAPFTFYSIHRIEFKKEYILDTNDVAYSTNLVQGERVDIYSENGRISKLSYLETMIIPAASGKVIIVNKGKNICKMVLVYIKPGIGITEPVNNPID